MLGVKHTASYTDMRFKSMPFPTLFGLSSLLKEYKIETHGYKIDDKNAIGEIPRPFIAPINNRFVIVHDIEDNSVKYCTLGVAEQIPVEEFVEAWSGVAFCATTTSASIEPKYFTHYLSELMVKVRNYSIWVIGLVLFAWFFITRGDLHNWGTIAMVGVDLFGLWLASMLVGKDLGIKSKRSDAVCNVLEPGGCDRITKSDASTFLGIFHWSEVGLTYFSVGLATLLLFPHMAGWLAGINICALPYTIWSISYQKFKAKTWCTMCVGVQLTLWVQFIIFLCSGWVGKIFPLKAETFALLLVYAFVMLVINRIDSFIKSRGEKGA